MELRTTLQQAAALLQAGRISDSADLCRQVLAAVPGQPDALHLLALVARNRGEAAEAERLFRASIVAAPTADVLVNYGVFLRGIGPVSYTHLRAHETVLDLVCRLLLEKTQ